jgi:type IV secretion system protein VirB5
MKLDRKGVLLGAVLLLGSATAPAIAGGVPVIDATAIAEAIKQYEQLQAQLKTMNSHLEQAQQLNQSLSGSRGMQDLMPNEVRNVIPTNWQETLAQMGGAGKLSELAQSIKANASKMDVATLKKLLPEEMASTAEGFADSAASAQASAGQAYDNASNRFSRLQALMDALPGAQDMKAVADLQARIQGEQVMLQNEAIKLAALAQAQQAQQAIQNQQVRELGMDKPYSGNSLPSVVR